MHASYTLITAGDLLPERLLAVDPSGSLVRWRNLKSSSTPKRVLVNTVWVQHSIVHTLGDFRTTAAWVNLEDPLVRRWQPCRTAFKRRDRHSLTGGTALGTDLWG